MKYVAPLALSFAAFSVALGAASCGSSGDEASGASGSTTGGGSGATTSTDSSSSTTSTGTGTPGSCEDTMPTGFPYIAKCCEYTTSIPAELVDAGFDESTLGADPTPVHVHVSYAGPTSTTFAVNWKTDDDTKVSLALYGSDEAAVAAADGPGGAVQRTYGHHMLYASLLNPSDTTRVHEAHICGLEPDKTYYYKVGGPGAWSNVYAVGTGPELGSKGIFRFGVTGDSRNDPTIFAQAQEALFQKGIDFQLFSGDAVATGVSQKDWDDLLGSTSGSFKSETMLAQVPFMLANGNHDALSVNYVAQFAMPQEVNGDELAEGEEWYSFDYGNAHFVFLNDTPKSRIDGAQLDWLDQDLAAVDRAKTPWVFVNHHQGSYSCSTNHGSNKDIRAVWQPIYDKYKVDIVFNGHDHDYERSKPIRGFQPGSDDGALAEAGANDIPVNESGTVYIVAAGVGAPLYGVDTCYHTHVIESVRNYALVEIEDRTLRYTAYRLDGTTPDEFEYSK